MTLPQGGVLGQTKVAKELIVGDPLRLERNATRLEDEARRVDGLLEDLDAISTPGWNNGLGAPAYDAARAAEREKWGAFHTILSRTGTSLATYAGALRTAQSSAQDAIDLWEKGEQQTRDARASYNDAVKVWNRLVGTPRPVIPRYGGGPPLLPGPVLPQPVFSDPGEATRAEAQKILDDARKTLDKAGHTALTELGAPTKENKDKGKDGEGDDESPWFGAEGSAEGPSISWDLWDKTFGKNPADGPDGKYDDDHGDHPFKITLGNAKGSAWIFKTDGDWSESFGGVNVGASGEFTIGKAEGSAEATIDGDGVRVNAEGKLVVIGADGEAHADWGPAEVGVSGSASVEASAEGHLSANLTRAHAGGELFAGGRVEVGAEGDVGGVGGEVKAEGWAGAGIAGDVDVGYHDGKITLAGSGGVALGFGGKLSGGVTLDLPKIWETGGDIVDGLGSLLP